MSCHQGKIAHDSQISIDLYLMLITDLATLSWAVRNIKLPAEWSNLKKQILQIQNFFPQISQLHSETTCFSTTVLLHYSATESIGMYDIRLWSWLCAPVKYLDFVFSRCLYEMRYFILCDRRRLLYLYEESAKYSRTVWSSKKEYISGDIDDW